MNEATKTIVVSDALKLVEKRFRLIKGEFSTFPDGAIKVELADFLELPLDHNEIAFYEEAYLKDEDFPNISENEIKSSLEGFREYLGQVHSIGFCIPFKSILVYSVVSKPWYKDFKRLKDEARELLLMSRNS